jgi:hypothetical protein
VSDCAMEKRERLRAVKTRANFFICDVMCGKSIFRGVKESLIDMAFRQNAS